MADLVKNLSVPKTQWEKRRYGEGKKSIAEYMKERKNAKTNTPPESKCSFDMNRPIDVQWQ